jgi:hypothetical protein
MAIYKCTDVKHSLVFKLSILLYMFITTFSLTSYYTSILLGGMFVRILVYLPVLVILLHIARTIIYTKKDKFSMYILWLIPFLVMYFLCFDIIATNRIYIKEIGGIKVNVSTLHLTHAIPALLISWYMLQMKDIAFNKLLAVFVFIMFTANFVLTLFVLKDNPLASRTLATGIGGEEYAMKGVSGFDITYSAILLIPCIMFLIVHSNRVQRLCLLAFFALTIIYIYMCSYVIAMLASLFVIVAYLFTLTNRKIKAILAVPIIVLIIAMIDTSTLYDAIDLLIYKIGLEPVRTRIKDFAYLIMYGDTSAETLSRLFLYKRSLKGFIESPIIGIFVLDSTYDLSGHSTILDILAGCGLMGFIPLCIYLYYSYKYSIMYINSESYRKCMLSTYLAFVFIATLNPQLASPNVLFTLLVINPIICSVADTT